MFHVVEFKKSAGGGLGLIRDEWLTPRKLESFWPLYKHTAKFNKCLIGGQQPGDDWDLFSVERIFYSTDDILKARQKIKNAESESKLVTEVEEEGRNKRKRKLCRKLISSSSDESDYERSCKVPTSNQCASTSAIKILNLPNKPANLPTAICYNNQKIVNVPNRAVPEPSTEGSCIASELSFPKASSSKANLCTQFDDSDNNGGDMFQSLLDLEAIKANWASRGRGRGGRGRRGNRRGRGRGPRGRGDSRPQPQEETIAPPEPATEPEQPAAPSTASQSPGVEFVLQKEDFPALH